MKIFSKEKFLEIAAITSQPVISIYTATSRLSTNAYHEDKTRFKNALSAVQKDLEADKGFTKKEIDLVLSPGWDLLNNQSLWMHNSDMLAVILYEGKIEIVQLPVEIKESVYFIGQRPYMIPMIPELTDDGHYYLLLLNLDGIRLYEATRNVIHEIDNPGVHSSFVASEADREEKSLQGRSAGSGARFHGHSEDSDEERKKRMLNFFHKVDNILTPLLNQNPLPLFLAGVDYLIPIYRQANGYGYLMDIGHVGGAFNNNDMLDLHARSWEVASPYFEKERLKRKAAFEAKNAAGLAIKNDKLAIIKAAITGVVETLLVNEVHTHTWGKYHEATHTVELSEPNHPESHCLIDVAAVQTLANKGKVYIADSSNLAHDAKIAATLRFPLG